jgi:diguanylate cyclase (GGDEF)-like protein/PAS domain S-box-containing protein
VHQADDVLGAEAPLLALEATGPSMTTRFVDTPASDRDARDRLSRRALIADDEPVARAAISAQLNQRFTLVPVAHDANSAIAIARQHHPDVALVDVEMPGGGLHATRGIRRDSPETAVVILTADDPPSSVLQFLDAGAIAYLRKGISADQLRAQLDEAIAAHQPLFKRTDRLRKAAENRFRAAFDQAGVGMAILALEGPEAGRVVDANAAYGHMLGRESSELIGAHVEKWTHPDDLRDGLGDPLVPLVRGDVERVNFEQRYVHRNGHVVCALATAASFLDEDARRVAITQVLDISERKRFERQLQYAADHDALTGLFNRQRFNEELEREVIRSRSYGGRGAVLALDLDGFKSLNDLLGHATGDELVARLAGTLRRALRESDIIARTGGDEFAVLLPEADERGALAVGEKLLAAIRRDGSVARDDRRTRVTTSIGITLFQGSDQATAEDLMVEADIAMYDAKAAGRDRHCVYIRDERRRERIAARQDWLHRLRRAVEEESFVLHAQPIVPVCSNGLPRFELLLRMPDDDGGLLAPGTFLYNAERFDLIQQIDRWVMTQAVQLLHKYHSQDRDIALAINLSVKTLNEGTIADHLRQLLERWPIPEGRLIVEVTETAAIASIGHVRDLARDLRKLGCQIALDDFGAGFATFYYLKHLEFDYIKIDGEFVRRLPETVADQLVVRAVVDVARGLGAETVAEFVQDDETLALLHDLGVGYAQGYHTGRPGALEAVLPPIDTTANSTKHSNEAGE